LLAGLQQEIVAVQASPSYSPGWWAWLAGMGQVPDLA
jgi:hypothetical protein